MKFLALFRGINVGGKNIINMVDLKKCFLDQGFSDVVTYIQSGNVVFSSKIPNPDFLSLKIQTSLSDNYGIVTCVIVMSLKELKRIVMNAPSGFGSIPDQYKYDVIFIKPPVIAEEILRKIKLNPEIDKVAYSEHVIYLSRARELSHKSKFRAIIQIPEYKNITIRNWNTTYKLLEFS